MAAKFDYVYECLEPLLTYKNCSFGYQRRNCKKHGHLKKRISRVSGEVSYEIKIEREDFDAALIYTFIHELTHHLNDHLDNRNLTYAQQEWVADEVGMYFIKKLGLMYELESSKLAKKWDIHGYGDKYIANKRISTKRRKLMTYQKDNTIDKISVLLLKKHQKHQKQQQFSLK